ncbi:GNAT family N-acetyltransferase [Patulibacter defluvii]|uniref:GNAT family N-acetyltransferase n=1 Tax=Patulibacter defluvii TaxID=3095358 RepID=UPI002A753258|nr:N-acetyltransferase family protein [Patulibacter sp. DM4]
MPEPPALGTIRDATAADAAACAAIYAPYVRETVVSFEQDPPSAAAMAERIAAAQARHAWLVLTDDRAGGRVVGYAYGGPFAGRPAYRWACEVSVYLDREHRGRGGGRALYAALLERLAARGLRQALAGMTLPNDASAGLHRALGFAPAGVYRRVGWKHGAWHDVAWVQRSLGDGDDPPAEPR